MYRCATAHLARFWCASVCHLIYVCRFYSAPPPPGFNGATGATNPWLGGVGFVAGMAALPCARYGRLSRRSHARDRRFRADYNKDGFGAGSPTSFSGDYFMPGAPLEGWSLQAESPELGVLR
jgi:hypothetical protein